MRSTTYQTTYLRGALAGETSGGTSTYRGQLVVPVVALVGGTVIHPMNVGAPEYVPPAALSTGVESWPGKPVLLGHPQRNGQQVSATTPGVCDQQQFGVILNSRVEGRRLLMDVALDPEAAERIGAGSIIKRIRAGEHAEVSVGCYVTAVNVPGTVDGKPYATRWKTIQPDHLAFVPKGACDRSMGCGTRAAAFKGELTMRDHLEPPDPYAPGLALMRGDQATTLRAAEDRLQGMATFRRQYLEYTTASRAAAAQPADDDDDVYAHPPDPYAEALTAMRRREGL